MSAAVWYWRQNKEEGGPITWEKLQAMAVKGKLGPNDWVRRDGWNDWRLACEAQEDSGPPTTDQMPPPLPPPLPLHMADHAVVPAPAFPGLPPSLPVAPPPPTASPTMQYQPMPGDGVLPPPIMPPLPPLESYADDGPPSPDQTADSATTVHQLRTTLLHGTSDEQPAGPRMNYAAAAAMAAAAVGLVALPFETGLLALALGGWTLRTADPANGRKLAVAAVAVGGLNVAFRVLAATVDLGLPL